ncbi:translocation/assembly module TamB domain-containing protein [Parvibaculum sp.]|uniref:translocation/assembly module TamB domain-containing protein n=1 Tax=Parvibaculum sp. TaxID=2024848 RepID=UPI00320CF96C
MARAHSPDLSHTTGIVRAAGAIAFGLAATALALVATALVILQVPNIRERILTIALDAINQGGTKVEIGELGGTWPQHLEIRKLTVSDSKGVWLSLDEAKLDWRPSSLLLGTFRVENLSAVALGISRPPISGTPSTSGGFSLPVLPVAIRIDSAKFERLTLGKRLTGIDEMGMLAQLDATAQLGLSANRLNLTLAAQRTDRVPGRIDANILFDRRTQGLDAAMFVEDGSKAKPGLVATLGHVAGAERVTLTARARNENGKVTGDANLDAGSALTLSARTEGSWIQTLTLSTALSADGSVVANALADLGRARHVELAADMALDSDDTLTLKNLHLDAAPFALTGGARLTRAFSATMHELAAEGTLSGLDRFAGKAGNAALAAIQWRIVTQIDRASDLAHIEEARITTPSGKLALSGDVSLDGRNVKGAAEAAIDDLSPFGALIGQDVSGAARITLSPFARASDGDGAGDVVIKTKGVNFRDDTLNRLLGGDIAVDASLLLPKPGGFAFPSIAITPSSGTYRFEASLSQSANKVLSGEAHFEADRIETLLPGGDIAGRLNAEASLAGSLAAPRGTVRAKLANGSLVGFSTRLTTLDVTADEGGDGPLAFRFDGPDGKLALDATLSLPDEGGARLDALKADLFGTSLEGALSMSGEGLLTGTLKSDRTSLNAFTVATGVAIDGSGSVTLTAEPRGGKQHATLTVRAQQANIDIIDRIDLERIALDVQADDLFGAMNIDGTLEAPAGQVGLTRLATTRLTAKGPLAKLALALDAAGTRESYKLEPVSLAATAIYAEKPNTLSVSKFDFALGSASLALAEPTTIGVRGGADAKAVSFNAKGPSGSGTIKGSLALRSRAVRLDLEANGVPLELASPFLLSETARGLGDARLTLDSGRETGSLSLKLSKLTLAQADETERPAFDATLDGKWARGRLDLSATAMGVSTRPFELKASLPVIRAPDGAWPTLARRGAVSGSLDWEGPAASLVALADLTSQQLSGNATVALRASGDISGPLISGQATLTNGVYENFDSGTVLRALSLSLTGRNSQMVNFTLDATDGAKGHVAASGEIHLAKSAFPAISANATFTNAHLVRRSEADMAFDGALELAGPTFPPGPDAPLTIKGKLATTLAEIRIPEQLSSSVAQIDVVEVNGPPSRIAAAERSTPVPVNLDIALGFGAPLKVGGRGLDSLWDGDLKIDGTAEDPRIDGTLTSRRGTLDFAGKTFTLSKGAVRFLDRTPIDPDIDTTLTYKRTDLTANVVVTGRSSAPQITLNSDPELPRDEILSRILFDKGAGELSAMEAVQLANTLAQLSGKGGFSGAGILGSVQHTLGLDVLRIDQAESGATTVAAGKYIRNGIYVGVEQGALSSDSSVKVQIEVTPQITVDTRIGQSTGGDVGVNWKWDY